jgi:catechol 2,3-dioxygenase-like lactoylglutathione lyase family enzyme
MVDWYVKVLECKVQHQDKRLAFLTYDEEHHRIAFVNLGPSAGGEPGRGLPENASLNRSGAGVHHVAYTWGTLEDLMGVYERLKGIGVLPLRPIRHGLTLSLYYADPDGNSMEFQVDVLDVAASNAFMAGPAFAANPVGESFDPEQILAALKAGEPTLELILRSDQEVSAAGLALELA